MKKIILSLLVIVLIMCIAVTLTACNRHRHVLGDMIDEVPEICEENGVKAHYKCIERGALFDANKNEVKSSNLLIAAAHLFGDWDEVYSATEQNSGLKTCSCMVCGKI